jgi:allophanate hydrolase subunit 2
MFEFIGHGLYKEVQSPKFGQQDLGISPGGPQDLFSYNSGNILLNNETDSPALEIIQSSQINFNEDLFFVLTGAARKAFLNDIPIKHAVVYRAERGSTLRLSQRQYGFRTYLCYKKANGEKIEGRSRGPFNEFSTWHNPTQKIRVTKGPEYKFLKNPTDFFRYAWRTTDKMSDMGVSLERPEIDLSHKMSGNMISEAVADGTIQLTPNGPVALLRHRQTVGGYPRIFNVITADVDMLAQIGPNCLIQFKKVTRSEALKVLKQQQQDLKSLSKSLDDSKSVPV